MTKLSNLSYQERNHWIELGVSLWAIVYYFAKVAGLEDGFNAAWGDLLSVIVWTIVLAVVAAIVLMIVNRAVLGRGGPEKDERDVLIELKGFRNAYYVCSGLLWMVVGHAFFKELAGSHDDFGYGVETAKVLVHSIFLVAWLASVAQSVTHLYFYRRGLA